MTEAKVKKRGKALWLTLLILLLLSLLFYGIGKAAQKKYYPLRYSEFVTQSTTEFDLPPYLLYAVLHTESSFDETAVSNVGAMGLTQIMPETFVWLQQRLGETLPQEALFEPQISIRYGAYFYSYLLTKYEGDVKTAAAAYHSGVGQVGKWLADPKNSKNGKTLDKIPGKNARHYAQKILKTWEAYKTIYEKES